MSTVQRAVHMLLRNRKEALAYVVTLSVTTCLLFLFVNIQGDVNFLSQSEALRGLEKTTSNMIGGSLTLLIIAICFANTFVVNTYFTHAKAQEVCVYLSSGMNVFGLTRYLLIQNLILLVIAIFAGGVLGIILHIGLNQLIYALMEFQGPLITISAQGIGMWIIILGIEIVFLVLMNVGYAYKAELKDLLMEARTTQGEDKRKLRVPAILYVGCMVVGLLGMLCAGSYMPVVIIFTSIGMLGIHGFLHFGCRDSIGARKKKHTAVSFQDMLVQSNFLHLLNNNYLFILLLMGSVIIMSCLQSAVQPFPYLLITACVAYLLVLIVMSISMTLKIIMSANKRQEEFKILRLMGAKETDMKQCVKKEVLTLYTCVILLPLVFAITLCLKTVEAKLMEMSFLYFIIGSYLLVMLVCAGISLHVYHRIAMKKEEEEAAHEVCN